jgi:uncharacterized protein (TIGR02996 family)
MPTDRSTLIAAIRQAPDDDDLRLAAADWFEEQGDEPSVARSEFIRTQVRGARLPADDPTQSDLHARELRLLKRWAPVWCGSHFVFKKVRFRRGFIEYVHLHLRHFLHHRRQMLALEPVRDVRLTGWLRAPDDLVRRVAGCEEWQSIERLRIHQQGPHPDRLSNLVLLLESPHLTRLKALECPQVHFDRDARRRFERLPVLRQVRELRLPMLAWRGPGPGEWFSDSKGSIMRQWTGLTSLALPRSTRMDQLRLYSEMPFWNRLTKLEVALPAPETPALPLLRDRLPGSLEELRLSGDGSPGEFEGATSFYQRLARRGPLRRLQLSWIPITPTSLGLLLSGTGRCRLERLSLPNCGLTREHARALADSPGAKGLRSLDLSSNSTFDSAAAQALFASENLRSLVDLNLNDTPVGTEGVKALAAAEGWDRLRSLDLGNTSLMGDGLRKLLKSPSVRSLNWLALGGTGYRNEPALTVPPGTAESLTRLPHLASLRLFLRQCHWVTRHILTSSDSLAWLALYNVAEMNEQARRAYHAPERWPPVDATFEGIYGD